MIAEIAAAPTVPGLVEVEEVVPLRSIRIVPKRR
jgi:hypothetical protein